VEDLGQIVPAKRSASYFRSLFAVFTSYSLRPETGDTHASLEQSINVFGRSCYIDSRRDEADLNQGPSTKTLSIQYLI